MGASLGKVQLKEGSYWPDYEDHIIGNKQGLENLIKACESALKSGECREETLGDYLGVALLETSWFDGPAVQKETFGQKALGMALFSSVSFVFGVGVFTIASWLL